MPRRAIPRMPSSGRSLPDAILFDSSLLHAVTSPDVTARTDSRLLAFDTGKLLADAANALVGRVPVGDVPVGVVVINGGARIAVTNSNRSDAPQLLTIIDAQKIATGEAAVLGQRACWSVPSRAQSDRRSRNFAVNQFWFEEPRYDRRRAASASATHEVSANGETARSRRGTLA